MSSRILNPKIIKEIMGNCDDNNLADFIKELLFKEAEGLGWWRDTYKELLNKYSNYWGELDED